MTVNNSGDYSYFDFSKNWSKTIKPIIESPQAQVILNQDFNAYVDIQRAAYIENAKKTGLPADKHNWFFSEGKLPADFDSCDWRYGRLPPWHKYVCRGACHFIVNTLLYVAMTAYPNKAWRIVTSSEHSTIWDGEQTLFDLNFVTLKIPVNECVEMAFFCHDSIMLGVGHYLELGAVYIGSRRQFDKLDLGKY